MALRQIQFRHCLTLELKLKKFYPIIKMARFGEMYVTLKLDDSRYRVHSISDGNEEIVTNEEYVIMPWKMVTKIWQKHDPQRCG